MPLQALFDINFITDHVIRFPGFPRMLLRVVVKPWQNAWFGVKGLNQGKVFYNWSWESSGLLSFTVLTALFLTTVQTHSAEFLEQWDSPACGHAWPHCGHAGGYVHTQQWAPLPRLCHQPAAGDDLQESWLQPTHLWAPSVWVHLQGLLWIDWVMPLLFYLCGNKCVCVCVRACMCICALPSWVNLLMYVWT